MRPTSSFLSDMSARSPFVCRSCLVSLQAAQRRPTLVPWAATTTTTNTSTGTSTSTPTTALTVRTIKRQAASARGRGAPAAPRQPPPKKPRAAPLRATPAEELKDIKEEAAFLKKFKNARIEDLDLPKVRQADPDREYGRDEDVSINYYDQQDDGSIVRVDKRTSPEDEMEKELAALETKMQETSRMMRTLEKRGGPTRRRMVRLRKQYNMIREVEREEELQSVADEVYHELQGHEKDDAAVRSDREAWVASVKIDITGLSTNARRHVTNLNNVLRPAARRMVRKGNSPGSGVDAKIITALWSRYGAARTGLAESWSNIPPPVWTCLWTVLGWENDTTGKGGGVKNPLRLSHIYYLAKDMQAAGVPLTDEQQLLAMEAMFNEGWSAAAIENWRRNAATIGVRPATAAAYWELGVQMYAQQGDLERAERAADRLFSDELQELLQESARKRHTKRGDPRVLISLIRSAAAADSKDLAWTVYRRLRSLLDESEKADGGMKIEDYDQVVSCFLTANHTEYAFDVFVDMMFSGALDLHQQKLQARYHGRPGKLPSAVANHFFFGKWLKRLIGAGDLDGAYRVLHFMQARGIMTASVQVNGLIGAWLRSTVATDQERAETLAWRMIESRRLFVELRRREEQMKWPLQLRVGGFTANEAASAASAASSQDASDELTFVPRATLETFILMADNYKNRGQFKDLERLWKAYRECEMASTDAFMMNQLLESYVHEGRSADARALYRDLVMGPQRIQPNAHTYLLLFRSLAVHRTVFFTLTDDERRAASEEARQLVADMAKVAPVAFRTEVSAYAARHLDPSEDSRTIAFYQSLGRMVLHTFRKTGDYVALCVMLHVLRPLLYSRDGGKDNRGFDRFLMTDSLAVEMVAETSALDNDTPSSRHRIFKAGEAVENLLHEVLGRRLTAYRWNLGDSLGQDMSNDLSVVVSHVYRIKSEGLSDDEFAAVFEAAADEMCVRKYL